MSSTEIPPARTRPSRSAVLIIATLVIAESVSVFEVAMAGIALPTFMKAFNADALSAGWIYTIYLLVAAVVGPLSGRIGDMFGKKKVVLITLGLAVVGSIVSMLGDSLIQVIIGRAIQGAAGALLPLTLALAREALPGARAHIGVSMVAGSALFASALAGIVAGVLLDIGSWHYLFAAAIVFGLIAIALVAVFVPRSTTLAPRTRIDIVGAITFAAAVISVLASITLGRSLGWDDGRTIGLLVGGLAVFGFWIWWELRIQYPMIQLRNLRDRRLALILVATGLVFLGPGGTGVLIPMILQLPVELPVGLGQTASFTGGVTFITAIAGFALSPLAGYLSARFTPRRVLLAGSVASALGLVIMIWAIHALIPFLIVLAAMTVGSSVLATVTPNQIMDGVPDTKTGEVNGLYQTVRTVFLSLGTVLLTLLLSISTVPGTTFGDASAFTTTFVVMAAIAVAVVAAIFLIPKTRASANPHLAPQVAGATQR